MFGELRMTERLKIRGCTEPQRGMSPGRTGHFEGTGRNSNAERKEPVLWGSLKTAVFILSAQLTLHNLKL